MTYVSVYSAYPSWIQCIRPYLFHAPSGVAFEKCHVLILGLIHAEKTERRKSQLSSLLAVVPLSF